MSYPLNDESMNYHKPTILRAQNLNFCYTRSRRFCMDERCTLFVIAILSSLEERWKNELNVILQGRNGISLHRAFRDLQKANLLKDFSNRFSFNIANGTMHGLQLALTYGVRTMLVRMDGSSKYHLDSENGKKLQELLHRNNIDTVYIEDASKRLNEL